MKLQGHTFESPNKVYCVLPRGTGKDVVFTCQAIIDYSEFEKFCKLPEAPEVIKPGGVREKNFQHPDYISAISKHSDYRLAWIVLKSLEATEGLTWEKVKRTDPKTWPLYEDELKEAHFSAVEIQRIQAACYEANSLNESRVAEARENFLRGLQEGSAESNGQNTIHNSSQSGEPVSA